MPIKVYFGLQIIQAPSYLVSYASPQLSVMPYLDELTPEAKAVGSVNTTKLCERDGKIVHIGTNLDIKAILNSLRQALTGIASPFDASVPAEFQEGQAAAFVIGGGGATRVCILYIIMYIS